MVNREDLLNIQKKRLTGEFSENALIRYLQIAEHLIFTEENKKATKLLLDLGFDKKIIKEFIKSIEKNYKEDDCQDMKEKMQLKKPRRM
jgi:hypothetical protein